MAKLFYILIAISLCSCTNEIDLNKYRDPATAQMLVLNSIVNPDSTITVFASHPWFYTDYTLDTYGNSDIHESANVKDLEISITADGESKEKMVYNKALKCYKSTYKPQSGQMIEISTPYMGSTVKATAQMPHKVEIEDINISMDGPFSNEYNTVYEFSFRLTFTDNGKERNYYFLDAPMDEATDFVFQQLGKDVTGFTIGWDPWTYKGLPFSDYGIDGTTYTLTFSYSVSESTILSWINNPGQIDSKCQIKLFALSPEYYKYIVGIIANEDDYTLQGYLGSLGLSTPVAIESNVEGGLGILGCYTLSTYMVDLSDYAPKDML